MEGAGVVEGAEVGAAVAPGVGCAGTGVAPSSSLARACRSSSSVNSSSSRSDKQLLTSGHCLSLVSQTTNTQIGNQVWKLHLCSFKRTKD